MRKFPEKKQKGENTYTCRHGKIQCVFSLSKYLHSVLKSVKKSRLTILRLLSFENVKAYFDVNVILTSNKPPIN